MKMPEGREEKLQPFLLRDCCKSQGDSFMARLKTSAMMKYKWEEQGQLSPG